MKTSESVPGLHRCHRPEIVRAHGLAYGPEQRSQAIDAAQAQIANELFAVA
jgi:FMN-dependent NADH-azoreductase